jgi:hypothetical protein
MKLAPFFIHIFRSILKGYPAKFRSEFEEEMELVFTDRTLDHASQAFPVFLFSSLREFFDLFFNLFREHWIENRKELHMSGGIVGRRDHRNFIWMGSLLFGIFAGLSYLFSEVSGLGRLEFTKYSISTYIFWTISMLAFGILKIGIFWRATPRRMSRWGFLPSVLGSTLILILWTLISQFYVYSKFVDQYGWNQSIMIGWRILFVAIQGLVFGGLFGWAYAGIKGVIPFMAVSFIGSLISYGITTGGITYTYPMFNMNWGLPVYWYTNIWFTLWSLTLIIMSSMIPGALLGWQVNRANSNQEDRNLIAEG